MSRRSAELSQGKLTRRKTTKCSYLRTPDLPLNAKTSHTICTHCRTDRRPEIARLRMRMINNQLQAACSNVPDSEPLEKPSFQSAKYSTLPVTVSGFPNELACGLIQEVRIGLCFLLAAFLLIISSVLQPFRQDRPAKDQKEQRHNRQEEARRSLTSQDLRTIADKIFRDFRIDTSGTSQLLKKSASASMSSDPASWSGSKLLNVAATAVCICAILYLAVLVYR